MSLRLGMLDGKFNVGWSLNRAACRIAAEVQEGRSLGLCLDVEAKCITWCNPLNMMNMMQSVEHNAIRWTWCNPLNMMQHDAINWTTQEEHDAINWTTQEEHDAINWTTQEEQDAHWLRLLPCYDALWLSLPWACWEDALWQTLKPPDPPVQCASIVHDNILLTLVHISSLSFYTCMIDMMQLATSLKTLKTCPSASAWSLVN